MFSIAIESMIKISSKPIIFFSLLISKACFFLKTNTRKEAIAKDPPTTELKTKAYKFILLLFSYTISIGKSQSQLLNLISEGGKVLSLLY